MRDDQIPVHVQRPPRRRRGIGRLAALEQQDCVKVQQLGGRAHLVDRARHRVGGLIMPALVCQRPHPRRPGRRAQ